MVEAYLLFFLISIISPANNIFFVKKYQLSAGTSFKANSLYIFINGAASVVIPSAVMIFTKVPLQITGYSFFMASSIVASSAINSITMLKAYESGQMAVASIFSTIGNIVLSCIYGILFLKETLSIVGIVAVILMISSVILITETNKNSKINFKLLIVYLLLIISSSATTILSKQHQVESAFPTVDTLNFSFWIAALRTVAFAFIIPVLILHKKKNPNETQFKKPIIYGTTASLISGSCYIITLLTNKLLNISITSPLTTGLYIIVSTLLPFIIFREQLNKKQIFGVIMSFIGTMMFIIG